MVLRPMVVETGGCVEPGGRRGFSVKSCYSLLERMYLDDDEVTIVDRDVFWYLWKGRAPSKVLTFSWYMLLDRLPTRVNLALKGVLDVESSKNRVFCERGEKRWYISSCIVKL